MAIVGALLGVSRRKVLLLIPPLMLLTYQVMIGGDAWPYWRLVAPAAPYVLLLILAGVDWILRRDILPAGTSMRRRKLAAQASRFLPPLAAAAAAVLIIAAIGGDLRASAFAGFGYLQRYALLGAMLLLFLAMIASEDAIRLSAAMALVLVALWSLNRSFMHEATLYHPPYLVEDNVHHIDAALLIERFTTEDATLGVVWAGTLPYYTSRRGIDFLGKSDPVIARLPADVSGAVGGFGTYSLPGHNKYDLDYSIRQRRPTYVQWFSWGSQDLTDVRQSEYLRLSLPGPDLIVRRGDPAVRWDLIPADRILSP
jgi:hypothetical protein